MNITPSTIYWITRLDNIHGCCCAVVAAGLLAAIGCGIASAVNWEASCCDDDEENRIARKLFGVVKVLLTAVFAAAVALTLIPSTKEAAAMIVVPKVANSESVREIGGGVLDLAKDWLDSLKPEKKED